MEKLTAQQKANRAYYAKNAEKIKAQKRTAYLKSTTGKPKKVKPVSKKQKVVKAAIESPEPVSKKPAAKAGDISRMNARRRIEDFKLAKELGIEGF